MPDCIICIEPLNKAVRRPVSCPYCNVAICRACTKECLLLSYEPKCQIPECAKPWSEDFLLEVMPRVWMYGVYRKHREKHALDVERARLPETQEHARLFKDATQGYDRTKAEIEKIKEAMYATPEGQQYIQYSKHIQELSKNLKDFCKTHKLLYYYESATELANNPKQIMDEKNRLRKAVGDAEKAKEPLLKAFRKTTESHQKQIRKLESQEHYRNRALRDHYGRLPRYYQENGRAAPEPPKQNWTITMKCPAEVCEGFVGLNWSCGLCLVKVCKDCREVKEDEKQEHVCDPEKRESVAALVKEAKPCPKCAAQISKIDGCDQMWCTQCQTAFSWRTGTIEDHVHNPHYYEWMRRNGQAIPRAGAAAAVVAECLTPRQTLRQAELYLAHKPAMFAWIQPISHTLNHSMYHNTGNRNDEVMEEEKRMLRVKRLVNLVDDKKWGSTLELLNMQKRRAVDSEDILQMFLQAACDILRQAILDTSDPADCARQMRELATYANEQIAKHNSKYKHSMSKIVIP